MFDHMYLLFILMLTYITILLHIYALQNIYVEYITGYIICNILLNHVYITYIIITQPRFTNIYIYVYICIYMYIW